MNIFWWIFDFSVIYTNLYKISCLQYCILGINSLHKILILISIPLFSHSTSIFLWYWIQALSQVFGCSSQPRPQGFSLKKWVSPRTPQNPGCNKLALCEKLKLCVTSHCPILGGLLYLLMINERFYKISFSSQILATVIFCFPSISMKGAASNICKTSVYRAVEMTNKLSYMHKVCTAKARFLDSSDILFHFLRSGPPYTA